MGSRITSAVAARQPSSHPAADLFGFVPRFRWESSAGPIVRPSILAVIEAGAPPVLDYDALSVFLRLGFFVGDDTPFAAIEAVPAPRQPFSGPPLRLSRGQAVDAFVDTFRAAWRREPFQMPLS